MNITTITSRFAMLAGIENSQIYKWRSVIDDAVRYINGITTKSDLSDSDEKRLEALCAVYAFKLFQMCNDDSISSFSVGDVRVSSPAGLGKADKLWKEYAEKSQDLIGDVKFLFGRVM